VDDEIKERIKQLRTEYGMNVEKENSLRVKKGRKE